MEYKLPLFPYRFKIWGLLLLIVGLVFAYLYFWGGRPDFFKTKVFAFASVYMERRYFVPIQTNLLDELGSIFSIVGITFITFSKEKLELDSYNQLRLKAIVKSLFFTIAFWIFGIMVIYGSVIFLFSSLTFLVFLIGCYIMFKIELIRAGKNRIK
ncbi:MAG: hypothetical protein MI922_18745 [Bacteroidales bacterium]|nr:hypothetical protein [Bacteroidales bacterium]